MRHLTRMSRNLSRWGGGFTYLYLSLMLLCFCAIGVKAADINGSVKFNSGVRYSQWAINSRLHDFYGNQKKFGFDYYDNNGTNTKTVTWYKLDGTTKVDRSFDYVAGLVGKASLEAADFYENFEWSRPWFYAAQGYATGTRYANKNMTLDNMNAAKMYFPILAGNLKSPEATAVANTAINAVIEHMKTYNSTYVIGSGKNALNSTNANDVQKTMFGGWFHKSTDYTDQMWCDGQYMGPALLAQIIKHTGKTNNISDNDWDIIANQFSITWAQLYDKTTGLLYHGFTANPGDNASSSWAGIDKEKGIYHSASFWGRANAWYFLALVDILEVMPTNNTYYNTFKGYLSNLAKGIANYQDKGTGCWYQVMDKVPASLTGNYLEASCSSIFTAGYLKAIRLGLLDKATYEPIAKKAYEGLVNQFMIYDNKDNSTIQLVHSCTSAGLGGSNKRAGDDNYYLKGTDAKVVTSSDPTSPYYYTEGKVLGGFIMAATEYERAYQNQDSKQILFARDFAPSYNFTTTAGSLDATAYGNGTVTYQWYKDNAKIADATSATYTPKESGNYYCIATAATNGKSAGDNHIQTSTTEVTTANTDNGGSDNGGNDNGNTGDNVGTSDILSATVVAGKKLNIASKTSQELTTDYITIKGGTATLYNGKTSAADMITNADGFKLNGSRDSYMKITLDKPLAKGDVITATSATSLHLTKDAAKATDIDLNGNPYTIPEGSNLIGATEFYLWSGKFKAIKITRANTQVALTASFSSATISATEGDAAQNLPTLTVKAGKTTLTASDYTVTYASDNNAVAKVENGKVSFVGEGETNIVATIKPTDTNKYKETSATFAVKVEKKQTPVDPTESGVIYDFTGSIGTTTDGTSCTTANNVITFSSNFSANEGKYITIKPKTGGFKVGDVITLKGYCDSKNLSGVIIYSAVNGSSIFKSNILAKSTAGGSKFTYTIEKDCDALYLGRYGGGTTCLTSLQVERPASSSGKTRLTASFERNADVVVNTTKTATLPALTVKAGENILAANQYDVVYKSNAENVATLSGNTITINSLGIATITATVTPKDANTYEGTTATYQLSVKAPSPLNVSVMDVTINTTDAEEEQPIIKVYGDNDKLLKLGQDYTLSYAVGGDNNVTVDATGKFLVKKNAENTAFIKGTSLITVTATPTASLGSNYIAGTLQFSYSVSEGKIKPVFLESFKGITINLHQDATSRKIIVPLIYNGEDVSSYFKYTYTITPTGNASSVTGSELNYTPSTAGTYTVTVSATPGQNGEDNYGDVYDSPDAISFTLSVDRKYKTISVNPDPRSIKMDAGTTQVAPDLTVQIVDTKQTLGDTEYNVTWFSTSPGVVKVDAKTGKIEAVSEGTANIRVVVTGENLESTTALISVGVDDPAMYRVKSGETYGNQKRMWNQDGTLSVVLGGWMFPNDGTPDTNILNQAKDNPEKLSNSYQWDKTSSKAKWKLTGFDYYVSGNNSKNARQENGSNAMPETTTIGSADFKKYTTEVKDPMFNVPCSGSFLVFNPKTNGKVTAHIFQNGVFDTSGGKTSYRPQRRVFIMDEAGHFVTSTAHIESTNGKPTGGVYDLTAYGWDLNGGKAPTETEVASHFDGLESFVMTQDGFKNNVYPSALSDDIMPNNKAITNHPNDKSAHGWCVLADSPVTYAFNVKAGKTYYLYNFGSKIGFYGFSFDKDETEPTVDQVNYDAETANTNNEVVKTAEGHVAQVKIARKMVANRWTTCVLPFSLNKHQVDAIFGATYSIDNKEGTQILYFDHVEGSKAYFVRHAYNTIVAGKPFLIKPTKDVESINTADVTDYPYVTIENTEPAKWCESNGYVWTSSYNTMNIVKNDYFIGASDGKFKAYSAASGTVKGFRGFLKANLPAGAKPMMLSISTSSITDGNDGETTGIEDLIITADGEMMPANSRVYNINGQLVSEDASNFQSLPSGIYIINGKKYIK
ncbi:glycosyl hydrolase family 88 [Prevotella sp. CAG:604]|nr:glycosyl hydrolase family 88 [Prevotella sp. CAG:604]